MLKLPLLSTQPGEPLETNPRRTRLVEKWNEDVDTPLQGALDYVGVDAPDQVVVPKLRQ